MAHLTLAGLSEDGRRLLLVDDQGREFTLDVDDPLRRALRGDHARLGQLEIHMDSALRPRDIQARIRAGETPEAVAQAAQTTVDRVMPYASPVLAERAHVADRAQRASVRRKGGEHGARTLGEAVAAHLRSVDVAPDVVSWDAWRREDGRWTLSAGYGTAKRKGTGTFTFDPPGNYVSCEDDDARWLVGEEIEKPRAGTGPRRPRLSAVPADPDELPLGEDALEMVHEEQGEAQPQAAGDSGDEDSSDSLAEDSPFLASAFDRQDRAEQAATSVDGPSDGPSDGPGDSRDDPADLEPVDGASAVDDEHVHQAGSRTAAGDGEEAEPEQERPRRRQVAKKRGRASVPSWDEIMFGGGGKD